MKKPLFLTTKFFNTVRAGPEVVTMRSQSPYLFEVVLKLCEQFPPESTTESIEVFQTAFIARFIKIILDYSTNVQLDSDQFASATKRLTNIEKELFDMHKI